MNPLELIGKVTAQFLKNLSSIEEEETSGGVARFLLDCLQPEQVAEICRQILNDPHLSPKIKIQIPYSLIGDFTDLPKSIITSERTVHLRHASCDQPILLLANTNDDQGQSLQDIPRIGANELMAETEIWVNIAGRNLLLSDEQIKYWQKALKGLQTTINLSLANFAYYIVDTHSRISTENEPLINALGWALPALKIPRDSSYFEAIPDKYRGHAKRWENLYKQANDKRACYLRKQMPNLKPIEEQEINKAFFKGKEQIPEIAHSAILEFINSPSGWHENALNLALFEWEKDNIDVLFTGLKPPKTDLASLTIQFFEDEYSDALTEKEQEYLKALKKRSTTKNSNEDDEEFYETHRQSLEQDPRLKAKWDKFVYGQPVECNDFLIGLIQAFERLYAQSESREGQQKLIIKTEKTSRKSKWLELNAQVGIYFSTRYKGIEQLTSPEIEWETHWLFKYDELLEETRKKQENKYKENTSISRSATEIKFEIELKSSFSGNQKIKLIWKYNPNAIGLELYTDLKRLYDSSKSPFISSNISRELVSKKGRLQGISLKDVGTIMAAFGQDRGSLIPKYDPKFDLAKTFPKKIKEAVKANRLNSDSAQKINQVWQEFKESYQQAIQNLLTGKGIASYEILKQSKTYQKLLEILLQEAKGDQNRIELYQPLLSLGCIKVERGNPSAIIAPWHPFRLAGIAIKARQISGLLKYILNTEQVEFGDSRLFFSDLITELAHPYYPEIAVGYQGEQPVLLTLSDTVNDYSLLEQPTWEVKNQITNEDPTEATSKLIKLVQRYLELLPHEKTNLSIILYQCDSIKLPQAVVNQLASLQENQEESRCHIILKHRESEKLSRLYEQMIESSDADPDVFIASEASQNFMAKLRISVMSDAIQSHNNQEGKFAADIVFLQDVISRQAQVVWQPLPTEKITPDILHHVPSRWTRKRPAAKDELKSTVYLVCPSQPDIGKNYLDVIYSVIEGKDLSPEEHFIPARQISFQNDTTKTIFEEVHRLGEWVVNYDDLLERKQLINQGVQVIRYQQHRTYERNFLVSSIAPLNLLKVLVKRRLELLNLNLNEQELVDLSQRFIDSANQLSGDIVLRAAKCGNNASELIGVVLSKALLKSELNENDPLGWYFLDDYATWLGQKEGQIADILAISPQIIDDQPVLKIVISEAKYVNANGVTEVRKKSQKQLRDTVERINNALFITPGRLDRDLWLSRFGDLLLEGIEFDPNSTISIEQWREQIRYGQIKIDLSGYSHVFISGPNDNSVNSEQIIIPKAERCFQEIFSRADVRKLILAYHNGKSLLTVRGEFGEKKPWLISKPQFPAERVIWTNNIDDEFKVVDIKEENINLRDNDSIKTNNNSSSFNNQNIDINSSSLINQSNEQKTSLTEKLTSEKQDKSWTNIHFANWLNQNYQSSNNKIEEEQWLNQTVNSLRQALLSYDLQAKVLEQRLTPNAALIQFQGSDRLNISDIEKRRSQLLTTHGLKIIHISGKPGKIIVSVARPQRQVISLREVWQKRKINNNNSINLSFVIGIKEIDGEILYLNLGREFAGLQQHHPHTLIAGTTGSGKSVLLRNLLLDFCATNSPKNLQIYLIDAKQGTDYFALENLPHLQKGIIIEQEQAIDIFGEIVEEMEHRYQLFRQQKVNNLFTYNQKVSNDQKLPVLLVVHDEFADWMLVNEYKEAVSSAVQRLGVKARAAGIHLIFAAQRPDKDIFPMQLRDNLGNRLILRVESTGTSEFSLGQKGAENLLGKGHLVARLSGESDLIYAQVPLLSDDDFYLVAEAIQQDYKLD